MKSILIFLCCMFFFQNSVQLINWKSTRKHKWTDFRAKPPVGANRSAYSVIGFSYSSAIARDTLFFKAFTSFNCSGSWYRKSDATPALLQHEDLHFDIGESYCRGLKKLVKETKFARTDYKEKIEKIVKYVYNEVAIYQKAYDDQTNHSLNQKEQEKWNHKVHTDLLILKQFSDSIVKVRLVK